MGKPKPSADELRRSIGYMIITFTSVFLFLPVLWFIHLFSQDSGLYVRWLICSACLVVLNVLFYYWKYPENWFVNLLFLVGIDLIILVLEYFWQLNSIG